MRGRVLNKSLMFQTGLPKWYGRTLVIQRPLALECGRNRHKETVRLQQVLHRKSKGVTMAHRENSSRRAIARGKPAAQNGELWSAGG